MCMRVDVNIIWYYIGIYEFKKDKNVMPEEDEEEEEGETKKKCVISK